MIAFLNELQSISLVEDNVDFIKKLTSFYINLDTSGRENLRYKIYKHQQNLKILSLSELVTETAINSKDKSLLSHALLLHSIEDFRWDVRENYIYLSVISYAYDYFKFSVSDELDSIRSVSSEATSQYITDFFNRPKSLRSLKAFGLAVNKINGLVKFDAIKPPWA